MYVDALTVIRFNSADGDDVEAIDLAVLSNDSYILAWCDELSNDISYRIYNTSGAVIVGRKDIDTDVSVCQQYGNEVAVAALNSTSFVIAYVDDHSDDITFNTLLTDDTAIAGPIEVDNAVVGLGSGVSVAAFNSSQIVVAWADDVNQDVEFAIYDVFGTLLVSPVTVDGTSGGNSHVVSVMTFNETDFAIGWHDDGSNNAMLRTYNAQGVATNSELIVDSAVAEPRAIDLELLIAALDSQSTEVPTGVREAHLANEPFK